MKKLIIALFFAALPALGMAAGDGPHLDHVAVDVSSKESLQRGAKLFVNYCLSCHSAQYMRYNRMGRDLGLTDQQVMQDLMLTGGKIGDQMTIAMTPADAKAAFGVVPPDLSVIARARGADWLYTYLRSFYEDPARPFGVNNIVFPDVGMPHVLGGMQGTQKAVYEVTKDADGNEHKVFQKFELASPGSMKTEEYDAAVGDLVTFLVYMGEPAQMERQRLGWYVLGFLAIFLVVAYLLKKEYWKDVH